MITKGIPPCPPELLDFDESAFQLKQHLQTFLDLNPDALQQRLNASIVEMAAVGHRDFDWANVEAFYRDRVNEAYLLELSAWHLSSRDYIGETLRLIHDFAHGTVLDFGGGIGTHAIAAACCPRVKAVIYCDLNPVSRQFVQYRADKLGLTDKIQCQETIAPESEQAFDTLLAFDVLEHLPHPGQQLRQFYQWLRPAGIAILNWYFFRGFQGEYPFHLDDPTEVETFFATLQQHFLEVFHPYYITTRCYRKWQSGPT
jgi:SAM-dependent methyltransferase